MSWAIASPIAQRRRSYSRVAAFELSALFQGLP